MFILKAIKSHCNGHLINRFLHSWSFHMKFMKLAEGSFHNVMGSGHSCKTLYIQSTLVISKSKGPSKTVRDIRTSTYQICSFEEKTI